MSIETYSRSKLLSYLRELDRAYETGESLVSDAVYDHILEIYESKFGPYVVPEGIKVDLPYPLPGLNDTKFKTQEQLDKWMSKYPGDYLVLDKIDGMTLLYVNDGHGTIKLYTKGRDGRGVDVSHLTRYMTFPKVSVPLAVRGEVVMLRKDFSDYEDAYSNPRNLTAGIILAKKSFNPTLARLLKFYPYHILNVPPTTTVTQELALLQHFGFTPPHTTVMHNLVYNDVVKYFEDRETQAPYEMDGVVIYSNLESQYGYGTGEKDPRHLAVIKPKSETAITEVVTVEWNTSRHGKMKPVIIYKAVELSGASLTRATGKHARFIYDNVIGPGAIIEIIRAGRTIPDVLQVISPAPGGACFPTIPVLWDDNGVELIAQDINNDRTTRSIVHFLETLEIKNFGEGRIRRLVDAGITSFSHLLAATAEDLRRVDGFDTIADVLVTELREKLTNVNLAVLLDATGFFPGIGKKRWADIVQGFPDIIYWPQHYDVETMENLLRRIRGIDSLAHVIVDGLPNFVEWLQQHPSITIRDPNVVEETKGTQLTGRIFVFSGTRDPAMNAKIRSLGGDVQDNVTKRTTDLIYDKEGTSKFTKAQEYGVRLHPYKTFLAQLASGGI